MTQSAQRFLSPLLLTCACVTLLLYVTLLLGAGGCSKKKSGPDAAGAEGAPPADTRGGNPGTREAGAPAQPLDAVSTVTRDAGRAMAGDAGVEAAGPDAARGDTAVSGPATVTPDENMARLLQCTRDAAVRVLDVGVRARLLLRLAVLEAAYNPMTAAQTIEQCQLEGAAPDDIARAFEALASKDLNLCLKIVARQPAGELRDRYLASTALALIDLDPEKAAEIAARIDSRIAREFLLLQLVQLAASQWPERVEKVSAHIIEPLYNDEAYALIAEETATTTPRLAISQVDKIEAELVKRWTLLYVGFRIATGDPVAALQLDRLLASVYYRDELYAEVASRLAPSDAEKALTLAFRISDPFLKKDAVEKVAAAMVGEKPSLALHILRKNLGFLDAEAEITALLTGLCQQDGARFEAALAEVTVDLSRERIAAILSDCCSSSPEPALRLAAELGIEDDDRLKLCAVCAAPGPEPLAVAMTIGNAQLKNDAYSCLVEARAGDDLPAALEMLKLVDDSLARDEARLRLVERLAAGLDPLAARIAASIEDPYLAAKAGLALLPGTAKKEYDQRVQLTASLARKVRDRWRQDELVARLARLLGPRDLKRALDLASGLGDVELQQTLLNDLAEASLAAGLQQAEQQRELFLDLAGKAAWCLRLAELYQARLDGAKAPPATPKTDIP